MYGIQSMSAAVMRSSIYSQRRRALALFYFLCMYFYSLSDTSRTLYKNAYNFNVALKFLALIFFSFSISLCLFITVSEKGQASVCPCPNLCSTFSQTLPFTLSYSFVHFLSTLISHCDLYALTAPNFHVNLLLM